MWFKNWLSETLFKRESQKENSKFVSVSIEQRFSPAELGKSTSLDSAIARPFRVLVESGRDTGKINHVFFSDSTHFFVVGSLCHAPSGRLIFFPGLVGRETLWDSEKGDLKGRGHIDHITLEPGFKNWHFTIFNKGRKDNLNRLPNRHTARIESGLCYWFGMSVSTPNLFEKLFTNYHFFFTSVPNKSNRSFEILKQARKDSKFHTLSLTQDGTGQINNNEFLHFDFLIDQRENRDKLAHNITSIPIGPPALTTHSEKKNDFLMRAHPVEIPGFKGVIWILVSKNVGKLTHETLIGSAPSSV